MKKNLRYKLTPVLILLTLSTMRIAATPEPAATLQITIRNIRPGGRLRVALFRNKKGFPGKHRLSSRKWSGISSKKIQQVIFKKLAPGEYAVAIHHDQNKNGKMDTNFFGRPNEGWCVSNNASMRTFGPPKFKDARFVLKKTVKKIDLKMRY